MKLLLLLTLLSQKPTLAPTTLNFGSVKAGVKSAVLSTTLTNPLAVAASRFSGLSTIEPLTSPASICTTNGFCWFNDTCVVNPLPANGSCTLSYTFQPQTAGSFKGVNIIRFADGTADTLNLIGTSPPPVAVVSFININTSAVGIPLNSPYQFVATTFDSTGKIIVAPLTWTSSNKSIATVDSNGLAHGIAVGLATITASSGSISKGSILTVTPLPVPPATQPGLFLVDLKRYFVDTVVGNYGYNGLNSKPWAMYDSTGAIIRHFIIVVQP